MKKLLATVALATAMTATSAQAIIGFDFKLGGGGTFNLPTADITADAAGLPIALNNDNLKLGGAFSYYYYADLNHPIPIIPNLRYEHQTLSIYGNNPSAALGSLDLLGVTFDLTGAVVTSINIEQDDFLLYWNIPLTNLINAILPGISFKTLWGIDAKMLSGSFLFQVAGVGTPVQLQAIPVPMGYLGVELDIPLLPVFNVDYKTIGIMNEMKATAHFGMLEIPVLGKVSIEATYSVLQMNISTTTGLIGDLKNMLALPIPAIGLDLTNQAINAGANWKF